VHNDIIVPENEKLPIKQKIAYGIGGLSEFFIAGLCNLLITNKNAITYQVEEI